MRPLLDAVWTKLKAWAAWVWAKLCVPGVALLVVLGGFVLVAIGFKELQIGGLLAKLFGKKPAPGTAAVANTVPPGRVDSNGNLIPVGQPDSTGQTQVPVVPVHEPGFFSDPQTVKFTPPGAEKPVEVRLPDGVKNTDVKQVIVIQPETVVVTVKDNSGVTAEKVDDLLAKYGGTRG